MLNQVVSKSLTRPDSRRMTAALAMPPREAQRSGVVRPEGLIPLPDRLVRDDNPAFGEQTLDVAEDQAEAVVEPDCVTDDLRRKTAAALAWRRACH